MSLGGRDLPAVRDFVAPSPAIRVDQAVDAHATRAPPILTGGKEGLVYRAICFRGTMTERSLDPGDEADRSQDKVREEWEVGGRSLGGGKVCACSVGALVWSVTRVNRGCVSGGGGVGQVRLRARSPRAG